MSDEIDAEEKELDELKQQIEQAAEAEKEKQAAKEAEEPPMPSPEPSASPAPEPAPVQEAPVTPTPSAVETPKDDPMEWAKKKGFKTPEDMARALLKKEQEFHDSRQKAGQDAPPPPQWQPRPEMGNGYQTPPPGWGMPVRSGDREREIAARLFPELNPDDAKVFVPAMFEVANAAARQVKADMEQRYGYIERTTARNTELMTLMQDPAFSDSRVQKEVHAILDSDPSIFQRERQPYAYAYEKAMVSLARKQLQQGLGTDENLSKGNMPPVTAGGGNGSAHTVPRKITTKEFDSWSDTEQKAFIASNGRTLPKR